MTTRVVTLTTSIGRELAHLAFVEQEIQHLEAQGAGFDRIAYALRGLHQSRRQQLYQALLTRFEQQQNWRAVRVITSALLRRDPNQTNLYAYLGLAARHLGDAENAFTVLRRSVALGNQSPIVLQQLAQDYSSRGMHTEAVLALRTLAGTQAGFSAMQPVQARINQVIQQEQAAAAAEVQAQNVSRTARSVRESVAHLTYLQTMLTQVASGKSIDRQAMASLKHEITLRIKALTPAAEKVSIEPQPEPRPRSAPEPVGAGKPVSTSQPPPPAPAVVQPPREPFNWETFWSALFSERMLHAMLYLGATLLVVSALIWVVFNWSRFSPPVQLGVLAGITTAFYVSGAIIRRQGQVLSGTTLIAIGSVWVAAIGWLAARLMHLDPLNSWLAISLLCLPCHLATTAWLRTHIFSGLTALTAISLLLSALNVMDVSLPWQESALLLLLSSFLILAHKVRTLRDGTSLSAPLVWIAQGLVPPLLLLATAALHFTWFTAFNEQVALVLTWWLGLGFYLLSVYLLGSIGYEQAAAWVTPVALIVSVKVSALLPPAWYGVLLLFLTPLYLWIAPQRGHIYALTRRPWLSHRLTWPAYNTPYTLALLSLFWLGSTPAASVVSAIGVTMLCAASVAIFRHSAWTWLASACGLLATWHITRLLGLSSLDSYLLIIAITGTTYWLAGVALERTPRYGLAPLVTGSALLLAVLVSGFAVSPATQRVLFIFPMVVAAASAMLIVKGQLLRLNNFGTRHRATLVPLLLTIPAALLPAWVELLILPWSTTLVTGIVRAFLAASYLCLSFQLPENAFPVIRRMLIGILVALTVLVLLPVPAGMTLVSFVALLTASAVASIPGWSAAPQSVTLSSSFSMQLLDILALLGGLATLALVPLSYGGDSDTLLLALLGDAGIYILATVLYRRPAGLYVTGGLLTSAWLVGLHLLSIPVQSQGAWLAPLALLLCATGLLLQRQETHRASALPCYLYGYAVALASLLWCGWAYTSAILAVWGLAQGAVALAALALLAIISTLRFHSRIFAAWSVLLPVLSYLFVLSASDVPFDRYGLAFAGLSITYLAPVLLQARRPAAEAQRATILLFVEALHVAAHALAGLALLDGSIAWLIGNDTTLALICLILSTAYALAAVVLQRPVFIAVAGLLFPTGATLLFATTLELLIPVSGCGLLWLVLAWGYVALAVRLRHMPHVYRAPLYAIGLSMAALSPLWALNDRPVLLATLGGLILLCLHWYHINQRVDYELLTLGIGAQRTVPLHHLQMVGLLYPIAALTPLWAVLLSDALSYTYQTHGLILTMFAPLWLITVHRLKQPGASIPFYHSCYQLTVLAPLVAGAWVLVLLLVFNCAFYLAGTALGRVRHSSIGLIIMSPFILMMVVANLLAIVSLAPSFSLWLALIFLIAISVYATSAWLQRQPRHVIPVAMSAPLILPLTYEALTRAVLIPVYSVQSPAQAYIWLTLAGGGVALAWWLDHRLNREKMPTFQNPTPLSGYTLPIYTMAAFSGAVAYLFTAFQVYVVHFGLPNLLQETLTMTAVVILYALLARRFFDPRWLYISSSASILPYLLLLDVLNVPAGWHGVALLPGAFTAFALGIWLHGGTSPHPRRGLSWALPCYLLAFGESLAAVLWSFNEPWALAVALSGTTLLYGIATIRWRSRIWLSATIMSGHLSYFATLHALAWLQTADQVALLLLPLVFGMVGAGLWAEHRTKLLPGNTANLSSLPVLRRLVHPSWAQPFYLAAAVDIALALLVGISPFAEPGTTVIVTWSIALLLAGLATGWKDGVLAIGALILFTVGVDAGLVLYEADLATRLSVLALQGLAYWWSGQILRWYTERAECPVPLLQVWTVPLQRWGMFANGGAVVLSLIPFETTLDTLPVSRVLALSGLLYVGKALVERNLRLSYLGSGLLVTAWFLTVLNSMPDRLQLYAIPAGIYLLSIGAAERWQGAPRRTVQLLELLGMCILLVVTFWQSLSGNFFYGALLGLEALLILVWGVLQRVRLLFFGGIIAFLVNLAVQGIGPIQTVDKALLFFTVGVCMVAGAILIERRRDYIREHTRQLLARLETWN